MRRIVEQIANVVRQKSDPTLECIICIVGRDVAFTSKPAVRVSYALALENEVVVGKLVASYRKPFFGKAEVTGCECESSSYPKSEVDLAAFGLQRTLPVLPAEDRQEDSGGFGLIDEHKPWLYRVVDGEVS